MAQVVPPSPFPQFPTSILVGPMIWDMFSSNGLNLTMKNPPLSFPYYELQDENGSKSELRVNWNGDGSGQNVWSQNVNNSTSQVTFNLSYTVRDGDARTFRFWEDDVVFLGDDNNTSKEYINDFFQKDDSFVYINNIRNTTYLNTTRTRIDWRGYSSSGNNSSVHDTEGYFYWDVSNEYFNGQLNDFRVYDYTLTTEAVADMYQATSASLELGFNEAPGATSFTDTSGNNVTVSCNGSTCPISGLPGRVGQALQFDGADDFLTLSANGADLGPQWWWLHCDGLG